MPGTVHRKPFPRTLVHTTSSTDADAYHCNRTNERMAVAGVRTRRRRFRSFTSHVHPTRKTCSSFSHESAEQAEWYVSAPFVTLPSTIAQGNEDRLYRQGARNSMSNLVFDESSSNREASHGYAWWFSGDTFEKAMAEERKPRKRSLMPVSYTHLDVYKRQGPRQRAYEGTCARTHHGRVPADGNRRQGRRHQPA